MDCPELEGVKCSSLCETRRFSSYAGVVVSYVILNLSSTVLLSRAFSSLLAPFSSVRASFHQVVVRCLPRLRALLVEEASAFPTRKRYCAFQSSVSSIFLFLTFFTGGGHCVSCAEHIAALPRENHNHPPTGKQLTVLVWNWSNFLNGTV